MDGRADADLSRWQPAAEWAAAWELSPALIAVCLGPDLVVAYQNQAARETFGDAWAGRPLSDNFDQIALAALQEVYRSGQPASFSPRRVALRDTTGRDVMLRYVVVPYGEPAAAGGIVITALNVTAEFRAEQTAARERLLAELTGQLIDAPDAVAGLQALTDTLVETIADLAAILITSEQSMDPDAAPVPPRVLSMSAEIRALGSPPQATERADFTPWRDAVLAGDAIVAPVNEDTIPLIAADEASATWLREARASSLAVVPLVVAGNLNGALVLFTAGDRTPYTGDDLPFLSDAAARFGAAIAALHLQERQREVAQRLQRALLPAIPPEIAGLAAAARYFPGSPEVEVGGDWWDVHDLGDRRVAVGIGDVAGRGISAAVVMGQARAAMHAASYTRVPPLEVMRMLDAHLHEIAAPGRLDGDAPPRFATACYAVIDRANARMQLANAGHLPCLIRRADGSVEILTLPPAPPLGLLLNAFTEVEVRFDLDDTLVLFTDGLVESREQPLDDGVAALREALLEVGSSQDLDEIADALVAAMGRHPGEGADDITLLVVRAVD